MNLFLKTKANKLIIEYNNALLQNITNNKNLLIEVFINYYGDKYKTLITNKINNTNFHTFISVLTLQMIADNINDNLITD